MTQSILINNQLFLPKLQSTFQSEMIPFSETLSVPVSPEFIHHWTTSPKNSHSKEELQERLSIIGPVLMSFIKMHRPQSISEKSSPIDLVTEIDQGIETLFRWWIHTHYPYHKGIGEEGDKPSVETDDVIWFVDPVDGTQNFINGSDNVAIHIGSIHGGTPYVTYFGLPFLNQSFCFHNDMIDQYPLQLPKTPIIGTEYLPNKQDQHDTYHYVLDVMNSQASQSYAIGSSIYKLFDGKMTAFYKPFTKLWDVIAPLSLLHVHQSSLWNIELFCTDKTNEKWSTGPQFSPFSNSKDYINILNSIHRTDCRAGLVLVTPTQRPYIRDALLRMI